MRRIVTILLTVLPFCTLVAQKSDWQATRCSGIDRIRPIQNLWVDADNSKLAANDRGVYRMQACDLSTRLALGLGEQTAFAFRGGNADVRWTDESLNALLKAPVTVRSAWYDAAADQLWLGTEANGVLVLKTKPQLQLVETISTGNSRLRSDKINQIYQDPGGRFWIASEEGMLTGTQGKWKLELSGYGVERVRTFGKDTYVLADGELWLVEGGDKWRAIRIDETAIDAEPRDFDIDAGGNLWILSAIVARYDLTEDRFDIFDGVQDYTSEFGTFIAADRDGHVWIGTRDKGLYHIGPLESMAITCVLEKSISCTGPGNDGVLLVKISGGTAPFAFQWSDATLQGEHPGSVGPGKYSVTVTDSKGLSKNTSITVDDPRVVVTVAMVDPESGPAAADGSAEATVSGGSPAYKYKWDSGETTAKAVKLKEGAHSLTVTDQKGCSATATVQITQEVPELRVSLSEKSPVKCAGGKDATLAAVVKGGKAPYQYAWNNPALKGDLPAGLAAGNYEVTVTDAVGTQVKAALVVEQPAPLSGVGLARNPASTGNADGQATVSVQGGTPPYAYRWDTGETAADARKLAAGQHTVTVTDANGCSVSAVVEITENILPLVVNISAVATIHCPGNKDAALKVDISGGKAPFAYAWSDPALQGDQPKGVGGGIYQLTVTDALGTQNSTTLVVREPEALVVQASVKASANTGQTDGQAVVTAKGGTAPYSYRWDNGETGETALRLAPGLHRVTVTDKNGCTANAETTITEDILLLELRLVQTAEIICAGQKDGVLEVKVSGGKGPFRYSWGGAGLEGTLISNLSAGTYKLTVTDALGTTLDGEIVITEPEAIVVVIRVAAPASTGNADGQATAQPKGGTGPYAYRWDNGETTANAVQLAPGIRTVTVTDARGCTGTATAEITENILPLKLTLQAAAALPCAGEKTALQRNITGGKPPYNLKWNDEALNRDEDAAVGAGSYSLTVSDAVGTSAVASFSLAEPPKLIASASVKASASVGQADGQALVKANGGKGPYAYLWDNGEVTAQATKLSPAMHAVTVTDANQCTTVASVEITENILPLEVSLTQSAAITCGGENNAALEASISGGKPPYQLRWQNPALQGEQLTGLSVGTYSLTVTDVLGSTQEAAITIVGPDTLTVEITRKVGATAERTRDGKATVSIRGGNGMPVIAWDNGENGITAKTLNQGAHSVTVTDAKGCSATVNFETGQRIMPDLTAGMLRNGSTLRIERLQFEADSVRLTPDCLPVLDEVYDFLAENGGVVIEIGGHTNNIPLDEFCDRLSTARSKSVAEYLVGKGIDPKRVVYKGYGKRNPIASNATPEGRRKNQRVEIKILKLN